MIPAHTCVAAGRAQKTQKQRQKDRNREIEAALRAAVAARRVRRVNEYGVAHAMGRRKTSTAQVLPAPHVNARTRLGNALFRLRCPLMI